MYYTQDPKIKAGRAVALLCCSQERGESISLENSDGGVEAQTNQML